MTWKRTNTTGGGDRGSAIVIALVATVLLAALGQGLVLVTTTDQAIAANAHAGTEALYAADAGISCVLSELRRTPRWTEVLNGVARSSFVDGTRTPTLPSGATIDLDALTSDMQARSRASDPWGANNPAWRLYAYGRLDRLAPAIRSRAYIAVWVADDPSETDGDASADSNGVLTVLARAFGPNRSDRSIVATIGGTVGEDGEQKRPRLVSWREVR